MSLRERRLSESQYKAITQANKPTSVNPYATLADLPAPAVPDSLYAEVSYTEAGGLGEIQTLGYDELLPAPGVDKYYSDIEVRAEITVPSEAMNFPVQSKTFELFVIGLNGNYEMEIPLTFINSSYDQALTMKIEDADHDTKVLEATVDVLVASDKLNAALIWGKSNAFNHTNPAADATILFKISYKINTMGTEL